MRWENIHQTVGFDSDESTGLEVRSIDIYDLKMVRLASQDIKGSSFDDALLANPIYLHMHLLGVLTLDIRKCTSYKLLKLAITYLSCHL